MEGKNSIAVGIQEFIKELIDQNGSFTVQSTEKRRINFEFSVEYNAVRILLIINYCGVNGKIDSKIKFVFYDFLLRYPICFKYLLSKYPNVKEEFSEAELGSIDKKMVKHVSSAWDPDYYNYLGFLEARGLIVVDFQNKFELQVTDSGKLTLNKFDDSPEARRIIRRCELLRRLYSAETDSEITKLIQNNFSFAVL